MIRQNIILGALLISSLAFAKTFDVSDDINAPYWNPRGKSKAEISKRAKILTEIYDKGRSKEELAKDAPYREKYKDAIFINSLMPATVGIVGNNEKTFTKGLKRNEAAGVTMVSGTAYAFPDSVEKSVFEIIKDSNIVLDKLGYKRVKNTKDIRDAKRNDEMVVMYNTQGADFVIEDLNEVAKAEEAGIKVMNFVYNADNALATGGASNEKKHNHGVTKLGKEFIKKANENGIVVDVSHSSNQTAIDAAKYSTKPIIASHSNAAALYSMTRNMSDEAIKAVGSTGGVVCPTGVGLFLNAEGDASPEAFVKHVVYIADLIGKDKVGFSTDYTHNMEDYLNTYIPRVDIYPPEKGFGTFMENTAPEDAWGVVRLLEEEHNWTEKEIRGFLGENLMRVYKANWK